MKRGIAVLLSLCALAAVAYFTASKWAIRHETLMFYDPDRGNRPVEIDLAVRRDKELEANAGMIKLPVRSSITATPSNSPNIPFWQTSLPRAAIWLPRSSTISQLTHRW